MEDRRRTLKQAVLNTTRLNIIRELRIEPNHISGLASKLKMDRSTVAYHLNLLKKVGIVDNEYKPITNPTPGWIGNYFHVVPKTLSEAVKLITEEIRSAEGHEDTEE